ncbi:MAG TPA: hypothetical protein PKA88_27760 [Polyangiaceae bacterium]|nr:hypothetical protein [Polyangiaceae bacterium]HMR76137.1 hypothetical protein [Polyangiaceae bacterium]
MGTHRSQRRVRWQLAVWCLAFMAVTACHNEGYLRLRGQVRSAEDDSPVPAAELHLRFDLGGSAWDLTCEDARASAHPSDLFRSDADGKFDIGNQVYGPGGPGCSSCKRGILCVGHPGFQTQRIEFDDCDDGSISGGEDQLVVLLGPD